MTLSRELFTIIIEDNRGRSNELNQVNQTSQTQLTIFTTGDYSFYYTTELSLTSLIDLIQFTWSSSFDHIQDRISFIL